MSSTGDQKLIKQGLFWDTSSASAVGEEVARFRTVRGGNEYEAE